MSEPMTIRTDRPDETVITVRIPNEMAQGLKDLNNFDGTPMRQRIEGMVRDHLAAHAEKLAKIRALREEMK